MPNSTFTEYRIVFEGAGAEAVTSSLMEKVSTDGVERVRGLIRDGISIEEEVDIARAEVESAGMSISVVDRQRDDFWTTHFSRHPDRRTWLTANIDATTDPVAISVDSSASFLPGDFLHIATECMEVDSVPNGTSLVVSRAKRGSIKQAHYTEGGANLSRPVVAHTYPYGLQGRRARVYEYDTSTDDLQGDGRLIWRGIISTGPDLAENGCEWNLTIDSIYRLLAQDIGGDTETPFSLRGFHYGGSAPLLVEVKYFDGSGGVEVAPTFGASGHFENVNELVAEINSNIPTEVAGFTDGHVASSFAAFAFEDGNWGISLRTAGMEAGRLEVKAFDTSLGGWNILNMAAYAEGASAATHVFEFDTAMRAPRGAWESGQIYPDSLILLNVGDTIVLESDGEASAYDVVAEDDLERAYTVSGPARLTPGFTPATAPRFRRYTTYVRQGTLADFRDALVANGPVDANRGAAPFLTEEDLAEWSLPVTRGARTAGPIAQRRYVVAQSTKLDEMLSMECRLLGIFPRLQGDGRIAMKYLELPTTSTPVDFALDDSNILIDEAPPSWEPNTFGTLNVAKMLTGYNPAEDEHTGPSFDVRDVTSLGIRKRTQQLLIEPKSMDAADFDGNDVVGAIERVLGIFSRPYAIIPLQVPHTLRDVALIGSACSLTSHRLPNVRTGDRGIEGVKGIVVRRAWNAATGRVDLSILANVQQFFGYAPNTSIVNSASNGGNDYSLAVSSMDPSGTFDMFPANLTMLDAFPVGTVIEVMEWDSYTQTPQRATVTETTAFELRVTFASAPTLTGTRYIRYAPAGDVTLTSQEGWAYMGTTESVVEFAAGDETAPEFAA